MASVIEYRKTSAVEYRKRADECIELAQRANEPNRVRLLEIAQAWLTLAGGGAAVVPADPILDVPPISERH